MSELPHTESRSADSADARSFEDDMSPSPDVSSLSLLSDERRLINRRLVSSVIIAQEKLFEVQICKGSRGS